MDSLSQAVLGASLAGTLAPKGHRRKALLMGAALGTLPDLDVLIDYGDAVKNFTYHRGFSHSLFTLIPLSVLIWAIFTRFWNTAREHPLRWFLAISLALVTHPLLDAHTAYGTQLFWPMDVAPTMWSTIFIIDPLYTLPLFVGAIAAAIWPVNRRSAITLHAGLFLSSAYLGWSWCAQSIVEQQTERALSSMGVAGDVVLVTPTPLNTVLWRVVVSTEDGFLEGFDSLLFDEGLMRLTPIENDVNSLREARSIWSVDRLQWFSQGLIKVQVKNDKLIVSDLRMGQDPNLVFNHVVANRQNGVWVETPSELQPIVFSEMISLQLWHRLWAQNEKY